MKLTAQTVLAVIVLFMGTVFVQAAQSSSAGSPADGNSVLSGRDNLFFNQDKSDADLGSAVYRMILGVSVVVVLGVAAIYVSKKVLPRFSAIQGKQIKVLETVHLGSRKTIYLIEIAGQQVLVGSTSDRFSKLADIYPEKGFPLNPPATSEEPV